MTMIDGLKNLRTDLVAAGAMLVASAAVFVGPAIAADYVGTDDDLTQLQQLLAKYSNSLDGNDPEGFASVFTEDAVWHSGIGDQYRCLIGPAAITDLVRAEAQRVATRGQYPHSHMSVLGQVMFVDENNAYSHQTNIIVGAQGFVEPLKGGAGLFYTGYSNDTFRRVNGRWLIASKDESSGYNPATRLHDLKYHPPRTCSSGTATSTTSAAPAGRAARTTAPARTSGYVGTADDLTQLQQLLAKYANSLDGDDPAGFASVFTENGVWHAGIGERYRCIIGHAAIAELGAGETVRTSAPGQSPRSHMTTLGYVTFVDENNAYSHQTNILIGSQGFVQALKAGAGLYYTGYYNDTFVRVNGRWLISNRDEFNGYNPATGLHELKYQPPRTCPPPATTSTTTSAAPTGTAARTTTAPAPARTSGYVGTADDFTQLQQVIAQYANALDGDDPQRYAASFTENGVWHSGVGDAQRPYRCIIGRAAIAELGAGETVRTSAPGQSPRSHMTTLGYVTFVDENNAYSHQTNMLVGSQGAVEALKAGAGVFYTGYYNDTFVRVNGRWLISNRDEFSGYNPATGLHDLKYHPVRTCPPNNPPPAARQN